MVFLIVQETMESFWIILVLCVGIFSTRLEAGTDCVEGSVRVDPHNKPILQFCTRGEWGYICARGNWAHTQSHKNADVVCQQLDGMLSNEENVTVNATKLGLSPAGPIHYRNPFSCTGYETELKQCPHSQADSSLQQCSNSLYAAASCKPAECRNGNLTWNESIPHQHNQLDLPLSFCARGRWKLLCGQSHSWTAVQAKVACRQLGENPIGAKPDFLSIGGMSISAFNVQFHCRGHESSLLNCSFSLLTGSCTTANPIAGVRCGEWPEGVTNIRTQWSNSILFIEWEHDTENYYNTMAENEDDEEDIWYTVYCRSGNETEETKLQVMTTSTNVYGLSPQTNYICCVELVSSPHTEATCKSITTGPPDGSPNSTSSTSTANDSSAIIGVASGAAGIVIGIIFSSLTALIIVCCCQHNKKKKTVDFSNLNYGSHSNPGYSAMIRPEECHMQQQQPQQHNRVRAAPLYDSIDRNGADGGCSPAVSTDLL